MSKRIPSTANKTFTPLPNTLPNNLQRIRNLFGKGSNQVDIPPVAISLELLRALDGLSNGKKLGKSDRADVRRVLEQNGIKGKSLDKAGQLAAALGKIRKTERSATMDLSLDSLSSRTSTRDNSISSPLFQEFSGVGNIDSLIELPDIPVIVAKPRTNPFGQIEGEVRAKPHEFFKEAIQMIDWFHDVYFAEAGLLAMRSDATSDELIELVSRVAPEVDISDFIKPGRTINPTDIHEANVVIKEGKLFPKGAYVLSVEGSRISSGFLIRDNDLTSPKGNNVKFYYAISRSEEEKFTTAYHCGDSIIYPIARDECFVDGSLQSLLDPWAAYRSNILDRNKSFMDSPDLITDWILALFYEQSSDITLDLRKDALVEELEHADLKIEAEKIIGRKLHLLQKGEFVCQMEAVLKPDSLLRRLISDSPEHSKDTMARSINELRAKLGALRYAPFVPYNFLDCYGVNICNLNQGDVEYQAARNLAGVLLGKKLFGEVTTGQEGLDKWRDFLDMSLRSKRNDFAEDRKLVAEFSSQLRRAAQEIIDEHFYV